MKLRMIIRIGLSFGKSAYHRKTRKHGRVPGKGLLKSELSLY